MELTKRQRLRLARQRLAWHEQWAAQELRGSETWSALTMVKGNKRMVMFRQKSAQEHTVTALALRYWLEAGCPTPPEPGKKGARPKLTVVK